MGNAEKLDPTFRTIPHPGISGNRVGWIDHYFDITFTKFI
jgi:bacillopeptidase F (M6 metalloprotease family)